MSLSLTPLRIDRIRAVRRASAQLDIDGEAVLFSSGAYAKMPSDMPDRLALAVLDVAGAAPQVARLVKPGRACSSSARGGRAASCARPRRAARAEDARASIGLESYDAYAEELRALEILRRGHQRRRARSGRRSQGRARSERRARG